MDDVIGCGLFFVLVGGFGLYVWVVFDELEIFFIDL